MKIRRATEKDKGQFIELARLADQRPEYWSERRFTKFLKICDSCFLFAEEKGKLVGYVGLKKYEEESGFKKLDFADFICVAWIAVLPEFREKGIGSMLLEEAGKYSKKWKKRGIWLDCRKRVVNFYKKNGYVVKGHIVRKDIRGKFRKYFLVKMLN